MTKWNHVEDALIRSVLQGDVSEDTFYYAIAYSISETFRHAMADQANEDVPYAVSEQRLALAYDAAEWWNVEGNAFQSVECLRQCWADA
jgi:hypothetical protein